MGAFLSITNFIERRRTLYKMNTHFQTNYIQNTFHRHLKFRSDLYAMERYLVIEVQNDDRMLYSELDEIANVFLADIELSRTLHIQGFAGYGLTSKSMTTYRIHKFVLL